MANPFAQHSSSATTSSPFANPPDRTASKSPFSIQPAFAKPAAADTSGPVKNPFSQPGPTPSPFGAPSLNGNTNINGNGLNGHATTKPPAFGAPSTVKKGFANGENKKKKLTTPPRGTSPQPSKPLHPVRSTSEYAKRIEEQLEKDRIFSPKWPANYSSPSQRGAMDDFHQDYKKYRDAARKSLIKAGLIDDPNQQKDLHDAIAFKGICEGMCPEFEQIKRIVQHDVKQAEKVDGLPVREKMIKALARSAAGQEAPLPMDVLSIPSSRRTVDYLIDQVLRSDSNLSVMHGFLWDRTRAIRRDFVFHSTTTDDEKRDQIYVLETIVRFHVIALHLMSQKGFAGDDFSEKQEVEQLSKALLSLLELYKKCRREKSKVVPPNEAEFVAYSILLYARDPSNLSRVYPWGKDLYDKSDEIRTAIAIVEAIQNTWDFQGPEIGNPDSLTPFTTALPSYSLIFSILEDPRVSYTMACFAEILFVHVRQSMLKVINSSYWRPRFDVRDWTMKKLRRTLRFDTEEEVVEFVEAHGIEISTSDNGEDYMVLVQKGDISFPKIPQSFSRSLVEKKRCGRPLPQVMREAVYDTSAQSPVESDEDSLFVADKPSTKPSQVKTISPFGPAHTVREKSESNPFSMLNQPPSFLNPATGSLSSTTQLEPPKLEPIQKISDPPRDPGAPPKAPVPAHAQLPGKVTPFPIPPSANPQAPLFAPQVEITPPSPGQTISTSTNLPAFASPTAPASSPSDKSARVTNNGFGGVTNTANAAPIPSWAHAPTNKLSAPVQPVVGALSLNSPSSATTSAAPPSIFTVPPSAPAATASPAFALSSTGATTQAAPALNVPATHAPSPLFAPPRPPQSTSNGATLPSVLGSKPQSPIAATGAKDIAQKTPGGHQVPAVQPTKPAATPMAQQQLLDAMGTFVPLGMPTVSANQLSKADVVRGVSKWYMLGDDGLLDQFVQATVEDLVYEAFEQHRQEVEAEKERQELAEDMKIAEEFRATKLVQRYGLHWKHVAAKLGSRRRRAENQMKLQAWREEKAALARREREIQEAKTRRRPRLMDEFRKVVKNQQSQMNKLAIEQAIMDTGLLSGVHDQEKAAKRVASDGGWSDNSGHASQVSSSHPAKKAKTGSSGSPLRHRMFSQSLTNLFAPESERSTPATEDDTTSVRSARSGISSILNMPHKARSKTARILEELRTGRKNLLSGGFRRSLPPMTLARSLSNSTMGTGTAEPEQRHRSMVKDPYWKFKRWGMDLLPNGQAVPAQIGREIRQGRVYERLGHMRFEANSGKRRHGDYESEEEGDEAPGEGQGIKKARTITTAENEKRVNTSKDERLERLKLSDPETYEIVMASRRTARALDEATEAVREVNSRDSHGVFWD